MNIFIDIILILLMQLASLPFFYMIISSYYEKKYTHKTMGEVQREITSRVLSIVVYLMVYNIIFFLWWYFP